MPGRGWPALGCPVFSLQHLVAGWLGERMRPDFEALQPGVSREQVDAAVAGLRLDLPEEVYRLYAWRNGQAGQDALFFPGYRFLPIEKAAEHAALMREILYKIPFIGRWHWPRSYLPIFELLGDYYVVVCRGARPRPSSTGRTRRGRSSPSRVSP